MRQSTRYWWAAVMAIAAVLVATGCDDDADSPASDQQPWLGEDAMWLQGEGTTLAKGIEVPDGARLMGPVFTEVKGVMGYPPRQFGYLLVDGDPYEVARDFSRQWTGQVSYRCVQSFVNERGRDKQDPYVGETGDDATQISCYVGFMTGNRNDEPSYLHGLIWLQYDQDLTDAGAPARGWVQWVMPPRALPQSLPSAPDGVSGPSTVDSVFPPDDLMVVDGSFLAGPARASSGTGGGFTAVLGVTGDPDEVFDAYVAQDPNEPSFSLDRVVNGMRIRQHYSSEGGGVARSIVMNVKDGNAWIFFGAYSE